jgi:fructoselysine 6-phosphate deglycase
MAEHDSVLSFFGQITERTHVDHLDELADRAQSSELFSSPYLEQDAARFLSEQAGAVRELASRARASDRRVYFVGSGGSWASMYSGKYLCDRLTGAVSDVLPSYELTWRGPRGLDNEALVVLASYSGRTEDTLEALRFARDRGAETVALVRHADSPLAAGSDHVFAYDSPGLYCLPLLAVTLFAAEWGTQDGNDEAAQLLEAVPALAAEIGEAFRSQREQGRLLAERFADSDLLYCLGAGPLFGLAYKFGLTVFMENMRIGGSVIESAEFRHGPAEMLDRRSADLAVLVGTDESREMTLRTLDFASEHGARTAVFDAADYPGVHPLLTPFVLKVALQWFIVYATLMRGIEDLDDRAYMGRQLLAKEGTTWP